MLKSLSKLFAVLFIALLFTSCGNVSDDFATRDFATPDMASPSQAASNNGPGSTDYSFDTNDVSQDSDVALGAEDTSKKESDTSKNGSKKAKSDEKADEDISDNSDSNDITVSKSDDSSSKSSSKGSVDVFDVNPDAGDEGEASISTIENRKEHLRELSPDSVECRIFSVEDNVVVVSYIVNDSESVYADDIYWEKYVNEHWDEYSALAKDVKSVNDLDAVAIYINVYDSLNRLLLGKTLIC